MKKPPTPEQLQKLVDDFNHDTKVGDLVDFYPLLPRAGEVPRVPPKRQAVRALAYILHGHTAVVFLEDSGCVAVTHCVKVKSDPR